LWATRKIGYWLNKIRLAGPDSETINQIIELSIRYGIVTPYTSYLITESEPLSTLDRERISKDALQEAQRAASAPSFGENAVHEAADQSALAAADAPAEMLKEADEIVRYAEARTFLFVDGVWVDTIYSPEQFQTVEIEFLSEDYFDLLVINPSLASALALGDRVIVIADGVAYEIVMGESLDGEIGWSSTTDEDSHYPAPQSTNIDPQIIPPVVTEALHAAEPIANPRTSSGGSCAYGLVPLAFVPLIYIRKRARK
jgi:Ca-activated chloride channel family protein